MRQRRIRRNFCRGFEFVGRRAGGPQTVLRGDTIRPVWGSLLALMLVTALNPVRLAIILLVISRPRPVQNLLAYGAGALAGCIPGVVLPLTLLHVTPVFGSFADDLATNSAVWHIRIGLGVLALVIAAALTVRALTRRRAGVESTVSSDIDGTTLVLDPKPPNAISRLLGPPSETGTDSGSAFKRLLRRIHDAWENGSLWVAFVIGLFFGGVEPDVAVFLLAIIVASGATIGTQIAAGVVFVVGVLATVEIALLGYLIAPAKTKEQVQLLHDWALVHRRKIVIAVCAVAGISLLAGAISGN